MSRSILLLYSTMFLALATSAAQLGAQASPSASVGDSLARITVKVERDSVRTPLEAAIVRSGNVQARTDAQGVAVVRVAAGALLIKAIKLGFDADSVALSARAGMDTTITIALHARPAEVNTVIVTATRSERRVEDTPLRVEVIDEEEVAEKVAMSPGDIAMMLNETSGLRVQATNPALGGANVRIQGLRGRYSLILADGLPLYGGQSGGLSLLQIPPVDLARVEVIKGSASALYGSSALGGVIDLISRRPGDKREGTWLLNQTSRGGRDASLFLSGHMSKQTAATMLVNGSDQRAQDIDKDGWVDMPRFRRAGLRPRIYFGDPAGTSTFVTGSYTYEDRGGGTAPNGVTPDGTKYSQYLETNRFDVGALSRWMIAGDGMLHGSILTVRGSAVEQQHDHRFGEFVENDKHRTAFGEAALTVPRGAATYVLGAAFQREIYRAQNVPQFNYTFSIPSFFAQADVDARSWLSLSANARLDAHSKYGNFVNPRLSALFRPSEKWWDGWTMRLSVGTGAFAPTPFVEETEVTGLTPLNPLVGLVAEKATSGSFDIGGPVQLSFGELQLNATAFASRVRDPLQLLDSIDFTRIGVRHIALKNGNGPTNTWGTEFLARLTHPLGEEDEAPVLRVTSTYTFMRSTECDAVVAAVVCSRLEVPLTPKHAAALVATVEQEEKGRIGLEVYFTGEQRLENNPYRSVSRPYTIVGLMAERIVTVSFGSARVFLNFENLTDVRQTKFDRLVLPKRGDGGRWTTDIWTDLSGFTVNGGVRINW